MEKPIKDVYKTVEADQAVRFDRAMREAGNRCDLRLYQGAGHGFFNYRDGSNPWFTETLQDVDVFLSSLGYLEGKPTVGSFQFEN